MVANGAQRLRTSILMLETGMKRLLSLLLTILCALAQVHAIKYNVYVKNVDGIPLAGVKVYSFLSRSKAEAAYREASRKEGRFYEMQDALGKYSFLEMQETGTDGFCIIECMPDGSVILDADDLTSDEYIYDFSLFHVSTCQKGGDEYTLELVLQGKRRHREAHDGVIVHRGKKGEFRETEFYTGGTTELGALVKRATPPMPIVRDGIGKRHGRNRILITRVLDIQGEYARDNARFVAFPYVVFDDEKDSVAYLPPAVIDGKDYEKGMVRRMGFRPSRDKLHDFRFDRSLHMQEHNSERFLYAEWAHIVRGTRYHVPGTLWYEDYNAVYYRDSLLFSDGKEQEPMRFLDWSEARRLAPIDRTEYIKQGSIETFHDDASFKLRFSQGRSTLNLHDSITVAQRDSMLRWLGSYSGDQIQKIEIRGYSSPEGYEKRNRTLSRERAATIKSLLQEHLPGIRIETVLDANDNIVPWETLADIMTTEMGDTMARMYAVKIRETVAGKDSPDAKYRAIHANKDLYDYLDKHVLERVRNVEIRADIMVQKILSAEEIIARFEADPDFRINMKPYQYYVMLCHLADRERWDDLYEVAKRAYEKYSGEREEQKQFRIPGTRDSLGREPLGYFPTRIPYPLAGYYYAVSMLRKGMADTNILKPYLDDGAINRKQHLNGLPFIVAQVLMYCQREEFDEANRLIRKYGLKYIPELNGLIMYVRCLDGQYMGTENQDVRDYIMASSPMNRAVMCTALDQYDEALRILYGDGVPGNSAKVEYLKAICHFQKQGDSMKSPDRDAFSSSAIYRASGDNAGNAGTFEQNTATWAAPMLEALRLDSANVKYLENDGYFNNAYRQMVMYFWTRLQAGVPMAQVAREYDALVAQMKKKKDETEKKR